jgi:hypothetical protein
MIKLLDRHWTAWTVAALPKVSATLVGPSEPGRRSKEQPRGRQLSITTPVLCRKALIVWEGVLSGKSAANDTRRLRGVVTRSAARLDSAEVTW